MCPCITAVAAQAPASSIQLMGRAASGCRRAAGRTARYPLRSPGQGAGTGQHHGHCWLLLCRLSRWCVPWHPSHEGMWAPRQCGHECTIPQGTGQLCPQQCCRLLRHRHGHTASPWQPLPCSGMGMGTGTGLGTGTLPAGCPAQLWVQEGCCALAAYLLIQPKSSLARVPRACSYLSKHMPEEVQLNCPCNAMREWLLACLEECSSYQTKWKTD